MSVMCIVLYLKHACTVPCGIGDCFSALGFAYIPLLKYASTLTM